MTTAAPETVVTTAPAAVAPAAAPASTTPASAPAAAAAPPPAEAKPEAKVDETTILGAEVKPKEEAVKTGAPEKYADFTLPEGMAMDKTLAEKATAEFKALGLSQDQAQKLVTLQAESAKAYADAAMSEFTKQVDTWKQDTKKQYGEKYNDEVAVAAQAINRFGSPELRAVLNETGLGNHPELVKFFVQVGHAIKEDNPVDGQRVAEKASDAEVFYPGMKRK